MFLQDQIKKVQRRIRNIEENPRPEYMKCNKLRYQIELEQYTHVLDAWKEGKPFAILGGVDQLTAPLGFEILGWASWGDRVTDPQKYRDIAVSKYGFPDRSCDRTVTSLGLYLSGELPIPRLMTRIRVPCDPEKWSAMAAAKYLGVFFYELNRLKNPDYENIQCLGEELGELVEFAEKTVPGIRYDEDKLIELLQMEQEVLNCLYDTYELRKRVPCPLSPQDSFRLAPMPRDYPNPARVVEYARLYREELFERAAKGIGGVREEKLRIAWLATAPFGRETFDLLSNKGVSLPWYHYGGACQYFGVVRVDYFQDSPLGRKLTPLEEIARNRLYGNTWAGSVDRWVDPLIQVCRELKIDAVVDFLQPGCIPTKNVKRITAQRLKEELGIPTLDLEGREFFDTEAASSARNRKLEEFLDMCIANKK